MHCDCLYLAYADRCVVAGASEAGLGDLAAEISQHIDNKAFDIVLLKQSDDGFRGIKGLFCAFTFFLLFFEVVAALKK
jgi:hypothetical protein